MLTLSPVKLNGAMTSRTSSPNVNFQGNKGRNNPMMQPDAARMGIQSKDKLVNAPKTQPKFGVGNEKLTEEEEALISREMAIMKVKKLNNQQAVEKIKNVTKSVGMHAFVHWVGENITWIFERLSDFVHVIKDFVKNAWDEIIKRLLE